MNRDVTISKPKAATPTAHGPGTPEKVAVLQARYRYGLPLHVEGDVGVVARHRARRTEAKLWID